MRQHLSNALFYFMPLLITTPTLANTLLPNFMLQPIFYVGMGGSLNTIDEKFSSTFSSSSGSSGQDHYTKALNRLSPMLQIGVKTPLYDRWLAGSALQWNHMAYKTPNEGSSRGQQLPNASFSSINFFGPKVIRDFSSESKLENALRLLFYVGKQIDNAYISFGIGPALFFAANTIYVTAIHKPNGTGNHLLSTSVNRNKTMWGGSLQLSYQYLINPEYFISVSYTYSQIQNVDFDNQKNSALLNGANLPARALLSFHRSINFTPQEFMLTINKLIG